MTLYVPTILTPFEPNCLRPKAPFEFLDDHTKETLAVGIDIGRNTTGDSSLASASYTNPGKINSEIYTYCVMSQVGVAAGLIVIIFTFLSIVLLLLLSYQATDYLIERATAPTILSNPSTATRTHLEQLENTNHDRIRDEDDSPRPLQLKGWVTQGYQVDRLPSRRQ
ncbi:hypothetical protein TWF191_000721 [Orbilia oligospora]|uniref:Uncharacterized protein n=1 Tax=Orbilia oligospora TaxID=2813651 RepID=A0A7C8UCL4_ORBOL|nr:hypothetical protein TWF191_000721 [Orbilia oligospora]